MKLYYRQNSLHLKDNMNNITIFKIYGLKQFSTKSFDCYFFDND